LNEDGLICLWASPLFSDKLLNESMTYTVFTHLIRGKCNVMLFHKYNAVESR